MSHSRSNISIVVNTWNEANNLQRCLESVKGLGEIIVVDMHSSDNSREIARQYTEHVFLHQYINYVEPARNFAISKATHEWVLVLDPDEEVPPTLTHKLSLIANQQTSKPANQPTHYFIPRKNMIFGQWVKHSGWWPDNQLRFFKKNAVQWQNEIHSVPLTTGEGHTFPAEQQYALIHHHYTSVSQWIQRMDRYTTVQATELNKKGYTYQFADNLTKPFSEFLRRFFAWEGYKDGVIGLNLAILQSLSELIVYLKLREIQHDSIRELSQQDFLRELQIFLKSSTKELSHWLVQSKIKSKIHSIWEKLQG